MNKPRATVAPFAPASALAGSSADLSAVASAEAEAPAKADPAAETSSAPSLDPKPLDGRRLPWRRGAGERAARKVAACLFLAAALVTPARADQAPRPASPTAGMTMRIEQETTLGDLGTTGDFQASFLPPDKFRVEGVQRLKMMELQLKMTIVGNGAIVKQLSATPAGLMAYTVDLNRIRKSAAGAGYSPAKTYDPSLYNEMVKSASDKKVLPPEKLDGAQTEGYELPLPEGRLSLPSNGPTFLPDPAKLRVWLNPKDGIARKVELEDAQGRTFLRMRYTEVKTGVQINPEVFDLQFPKDVVPTDITELILAGVETTRQPPGPAAKPAPPPETGK